MVDIERLDRALAHIEAHPEQHDQGVWARNVGDDGKVNCGTAGCLAGWVVAQDDPDARFIRDDLDEQIPGNTYSQVQTGTGKVESVEGRAQRLLGLNLEQGRALFGADNTVEHLREMRDMLAENPRVPGYDLATVSDGDGGYDWEDGDEE